jgi:hypothetical protein
MIIAIKQKKIRLDLKIMYNENKMNIQLQLK